MIEVLQFIFASEEHFFGTIIIIALIAQWRPIEIKIVRGDE